MRRIVTKDREYLIEEYRAYLDIFHPEFLKGLRIAYGSVIFDGVIDYAIDKGIVWEDLPNPHRTMVNMMNRQLDWLKKQRQRQEADIYF